MPHLLLQRPIVSTADEYQRMFSPSWYLKAGKNYHMFAKGAPMETQLTLLAYSGMETSNFSLSKLLHKPKGHLRLECATLRVVDSRKRANKSSVHVQGYI
jgi:hypothetical protein